MVEKFFVCFIDLYGLSCIDWIILLKGLYLIIDKDSKLINDIINLLKQLLTLINRHCRRLLLIDMREADIPLKVKKMLIIVK